MCYNYKVIIGNRLLKPDIKTGVWIIIHKKIMTKRVYPERLRIKIILLAAAAFVIVVSAAFLIKAFIDNTTKRIIDSNYVLMREYAETDAYASRKELENALSFIGAASEQFNEEPVIKSSHHLKEMRYILSRSQFNEILVSELDGLAVTSGGTELDISGREYFRRAALGEELIMLSDGNDAIDKEMLVFSAPIINDGKIKGTIHGLYDPFVLSRTIESDNLGGESYSFIVAPDGSQIISTANARSALEKGSDVWQAIELAVNDKAQAQEIIDDIRQGRTGHFASRFSGNRRQVFYTPISVNGWALLKVVTQDYIDRTLTPVRKNSIIMTSVIIFLLILLFALVIMVIMSVHKQNNLKLAQAYTHAENANAAKGRFLSRISHEIRTPLNAVIGLTEIARRDAGNKEKTLDTLGKIDSSSKLLLGIINDVLDMSAIENEKLKIANEPFDIRELINGIYTIYSPQCRQKNVELSLDTSGIEYDEIIGDSLRVNQIILNLLSNALKFTGDGGIVSLTAAQKLDGDKMFLNICVSDTGEGMDEDMKARLFKPFEQESAATARYHGGSGLGLSIVKSLVDMMHGAITVTSEKGKGTEFNVELPVGCEMKHEHRQSADGGSYDFTGKRCLLVEDNPMNTEIALALLSMANLEADHAENGRQAVEMFEQSEQGRYDIILMDILMPELDGYEAAKLIRASSHPQAADIPILAMSANAYSEDVSKALSVGMNGHIAKPIDTKNMFAKIWQALEKE